ncbi:MAG: hypothetical protein WBQ66_07340 [Blastocatellia bacterium]
MSTGTPLPRLWSLGLVAISVGLVVIACVLPVLVFVESNQESWFGYSVLLIGALGILIGQFAWIANPILALAWLASLLRWWIASAVIAAFGLLVALTSFRIVGQKIPLDEGGVRQATVGYLHVGFYVWLLAFLAMIAGPIVLRIVSSQRRQPLT